MDTQNMSRLPARTILQVLHTFRRNGDTNQRIMFDIDPSGSYLATGSADSRAIVYDIECQTQVGALENQPDAVGSVCFHPYAALMGVCTGQRHFHLHNTDGDGPDTDGISEGTPPESSQAAHHIPLRNGVNLYRFDTLTGGFK